MALLKSKSRRKRPSRMRETVGCTALRGRITSCTMLCTPIDGIGLCGREAPHGMRGRTQKAIANYKRRLLPRADRIPRA
jgi:hypothetical protein